MRLYKLLIVFFASCCLSLGGSYANLASAAPLGFFVGLKGGYAKLDTPTSRRERVALGQGADLNASKRGRFSYGGFIGYHFLKHSNWLFGIQLGYDGDGRSEITYSSNNRYKFTEQDINLLATANYQFLSNWSVLGKFGFARTHEKYQNIFNAGTTNPDPVSSKTKYFPMLEVGLNFHATRALAVFVLYKHIFGDNQSTITKAFGPIYNDSAVAYADRLQSVAKVNAVYGGVTYQF